ncbi:MAG TPA: YcxB family protein [Candidatus Baltobacteraceae bacterium]|nr:YcxB family protein [Candidatus Baltobacteraceae bacterium]
MSEAFPVTFTVDGVPQESYRDGQRVACKAIALPHWFALIWIPAGLGGGILAGRLDDPLFLVGYLAGIAVLYLCAAVGTRIRFSKAYASSQRCYPMTFTFDENGIGAQCCCSSSKASWSAFRQAVSTPSALIVAFKGAAAYVFPNDALPAHPSGYAAAINERIAAAAS